MAAEHCTEAPRASGGGGGGWPLKDIAAPHPHDVLCGRGGGSNSHVGNMHWRMLVAANKELYVTLPKKQKLLLSLSIVNAVRSQAPPGRFLQKDAETDLYYDVGDQRAQEKTSQALREGAPDIKKKVTEQQQQLQQLQQISESTEISPLPLHPAAPTAVPPPYASHLPHLGDAPPILPPVPLGLPSPVEAQGPVPVRNKKKSATTSLLSSQEQQPALQYFSQTSQVQLQSVSSSPEQQMPHSVMPQQPLQHPQRVEQSYVLLQQRTALPYGPQTMMPLAPLPPPTGHGTLEPAGLSFGTYMSFDSHRCGSEEFVNSTFSEDNARKYDPASTLPPREQRVQYDRNSDHPQAAVAPVDGGLEGQGGSFGTAVMSVDTLLLERAGLSVGSVMSLVTAMPAAVDGGLEAIGASFGSMSISRDAAAVPGAVDGGLQNVGLSIGSLSLTAEDKALLISSLREDNIEVPAALENMPTFMSAPRSRANLLECSDTDSDEEDPRKASSSAHPSADWERLQATLAAHGQPAVLSQPSTSTILPPPAFPGAKHNHGFLFGGGSGELCVPTTGFDRDLSALSVGEFEPEPYPSLATARDRVAMPPPARRQTRAPPPPPVVAGPPPPAAPSPLVAAPTAAGAGTWEEVEQLEATFLARGTSLAEEFAAEGEE